MKKPGITVIITGGTIDSEWDPAKDTAVISDNTIVPEYLERIKVDYKFTFKPLFLKDSRMLVPADIKTICQAVDGAKDNKILITHGTYTMPDTARYLDKNMKTKKAVVLTGSAIPLRGYDMSDAGFNLGFAIATLLSLDSGVRLAMNGEVFEPDEVAKNFNAASFFSLKQ